MRATSTGQREFTHEDGPSLRIAPHCAYERHGLRLGQVWTQIPVVTIPEGVRFAATQS